MLKRTRLSLAVSAAFGAGLVSFAPVSLAQTPTVTQDRVEITGSLVRRVESEAALPVTVLKVDDLAKVGVTNAEQAVQFISQNQSGITSSSGVGSSIGGGAFADLRALGIRGRWCWSTAAGWSTTPITTWAVDLNTIPLVAVDRIEVLTDGASAIYGTDAVAGVINFIMRREYQGFVVSGDATLPQETGGGEIYTASVGGGFGTLAEQWLERLRRTLLPQAGAAEGHRPRLRQERHHSREGRVQGEPDDLPRQLHAGIDGRCRQPDPDQLRSSVFAVPARTSSDRTRAASTTCRSSTSCRSRSRFPAC